jgi:hypothetical protein
VPVGQRLSISGAVAELDILRATGPTAKAFTFCTAFMPVDARRPSRRSRSATNVRPPSGPIEDRWARNPPTAYRASRPLYIDERPPTRTHPGVVSQVSDVAPKLRNGVRVSASSAFPYRPRARPRPLSCAANCVRDLDRLAQDLVLHRLFYVRSKRRLLDLPCRYPLETVPLRRRGAAFPTCARIVPQGSPPESHSLTKLRGLRSGGGYHNRWDREVRESGVAGAALADSYKKDPDVSQRNPRLHRRKAFLQNAPIAVCDITRMASHSPGSGHDSAARLKAMT